MNSRSEQSTVLIYSHPGTKFWCASQSTAQQSRAKQSSVKLPAGRLDEVKGLDGGVFFFTVIVKQIAEDPGEQKVGVRRIGTRSRWCRMCVWVNVQKGVLEVQEE